MQKAELEEIHTRRLMISGTRKISISIRMVQWNSSFLRMADFF